VKRPKPKYGDDEDRLLITIEYFAHLCSRGKRTMERRKSRGELPAHVKDGGVDKWFKDDAIAYIKSLPRFDCAEVQK
jgi:hypothetical protein